MNDKWYAVRVETKSNDILRIMDVKGYSHLSNEKTYLNDYEFRYAFFYGRTKAEIVKDTRNIIGRGASAFIYPKGEEPYSSQDHKKFSLGKEL